MAKIPVIPSNVWQGDQVLVAKSTIASIVFSIYYIIIMDGRISISQNHPIFDGLTPILFRDSSAITCENNAPTNYLTMKQRKNIYLNTKIQPYLYS